MPRSSRQSIEQHYSAAEVADLLHLSQRTVWAWIDQGRIRPVYNLSATAVRIPARAINQLLARSHRAG